MRANLGRLPEEEIAIRLRRTQIAVHTRWTRELHLHPPSKRTDLLTPEHIAWGLGTDSKTIHLLIDRGILPGRRLTTRRVIRVVDRHILVRWLLDPLHWIYFHPDRIGALKPRGKRAMPENYDFRFWEDVARMVLEAWSRWDDEWLTPGQVARLLRLSIGTRQVNAAIHRGTLPATRWGNWWIRKSAIPAGMTPNFKGEWTTYRVEDKS
jgi:hypothetical protein